MDLARLLNLSRRLVRPAKWALVVLTVYFAAAFLVLPSVIKSVVVRTLSEKLGRKVEIKSIEINPFALSATLDGLSVKTRDGKASAASFDELYVNAEALSLLKMALVIREFRLVNPYVSVIRRQDGSYNFSYLIKPEKEGEKKKPSGPGIPVRFSISNIRITGGSVDFKDDPMGVSHKVRDLELSVPFASNIGYYGNSYVQPSFSATVNGTPVELKGRTKPFADSLETSFDVKIDKFDIPRYFEYVPVETGIRIPSGALYTDLTLSYVQYKTGRNPTIGVNGTVSVTGLDVRDTDGAKAFGFQRLEVGVSTPDALSRNIRLSKVILSSPWVDVVRGRDGKLNLMKLMGEKPAGKPPEKPDEEKTENAGKVEAEVDFMKLTDGLISFTDYVPARPFTATIHPLEVVAVNFKTMKEWRTQLSATLMTDAGESVSLDSHLIVDPPGMDGTLEVSGVPLVRYSPYFPESLLAELHGGVLGLYTKFAYTTDTAAPAQSLYELSASLDSLKVGKKGEKGELVIVPELRLDGSSVDLLKREVVLGSLRTSDGRIKLVRQADGRINLATLGGEKAAGKEAAKAATGESPPWVVTVSDAAVTGYALDFEDDTTPTPVKVPISKVALTLKDVSTRKGTLGRVGASLVIGKNGSLKTDGEVVVDPAAAGLNVSLKDLDITAFQPYFTDKVPMLLTGGYLNIDGRADYKAGQGGPGANFKGGLSVTKFATVDKHAAEDLLNWQSLYITGADIGYNPTSVNIKKVALTDFYAKIIVNPDRTLNIQQPAKAGETPGAQPAPEAEQPVAEAAKPEEKPKEKEEPISIKVDTVTVQGGKMDFTDRSVTPNFTAELDKLTGRVSGLSSIETGYADVDVTSLYNNFAPIEITGKVHPFREDLFIDLKADLTDMDLSPLSPYSGKYVGYTIEKGKLSLDLKYKVEKKELDASNKIFVDQFTFGGKVDSPDATSLPVKLAVALLKDRNGEIHLDIPMTGRTDDPEFSYAGIILQVIWNLVTKAVTSPFALLGSIFGGGEDLGYVEFNYASSVVDPPSTAKLEALSKSLYERPALKLAIEGHVDMEKDADALRRLFFERKLKALKLKDMVDEGQPAVPVDEVVIPPEEYNDYLEEAYSDEDFPKPRTFLGFAKSLPPEEMEKLMLTNLKITDDDLGKLASERANNVKAAILGFGQVEPERVFIQQPEKLAPEKEEGLKDSRVVFILE